MLEFIKNSSRGLSRKLKFVAHLTADNVALRQQIIVLKGAGQRPKLKDRDRQFWVILSRICAGWRGAVVIVQPETVVRRHKRAFQALLAAQVRRR